MKIIYGYSNCTDRKYNQIFEGKKIAVLQPDQKYHGLLIKGLSKNGMEVNAFSGLPINRSVTKKLFIAEKDEREENATFHYYKTINLPLFRQVMITCGAFFAILKQRKKDKPVIICDCLNKANTMGMLRAAKLKKIPVIMIVTDLPDFQFEEGVSRNMNNRLLSKADGFIFLTKQMNDRVNKKNKPYIVLEGHSDGALPLLEREKRYEQTTGEKVVVYAGSIQKLYGIENLVKGFLNANIQSGKLHVFGDGDYREELEKIAQTEESVVYKGIRPNSEVVEAEQKAALLCNPRPTAPEYTKYSFPSKNMEYMASGTPVLTTKLPGMPQEYYPYVYLLEDESAEGMAKALKEILSKPAEELSQKGSETKKFVMEQKNNISQAKRLLDMLITIIPGMGEE